MSGWDRYRWGGFPPLEDVLECRSRGEVTDFDTGERPAADEGLPCPVCGAPPAELEWFWFASPPETWQMLCGRAGWMSFCPTDQRPVLFVCTILN